MEYEINNSTVNDFGITIIGHHNEIRGANCTIIGSNNKIYGSGCDVKGNFNHVYGNNTNVKGDHNANHGNNNSAIGSFNTGFRFGTNPRPMKDDVMPSIGGTNAIAAKYNIAVNGVDITNMLSTVSKNEEAFKKLKAVEELQTKQLKEFREKLEKEYVLCLTTLHNQLVVDESKKQKELAEELLKMAKEEEEKRQNEEKEKVQEMEVENMKKMYQFMMKQMEKGNAAPT